jgi:hypothetical protein
MNDDLNKLYNSISSHFDVGTFEDFSSNMKTTDQRKRFYDAITNKGYDIGNYDEFENRLKKKVYGEELYQESKIPEQDSQLRGEGFRTVAEKFEKPEKIITPSINDLFEAGIITEQQLIDSTKPKITAKEINQEYADQKVSEENWKALKSSSIRTAGGVAGVSNIVHSTIFEFIGKPILKGMGASDEEIEQTREISKILPFTGMLPTAAQSEEMQQKLNESASNIEATMKQYEYGIVNSFRTGNYSDGFRQLLKGFTESLPYLAMVAGTSGGGSAATLSTLGSVSASQRYGELEEEGIMKGEESKKLINAWLYGGFEAAGELFTAGVLNRMKSALKGVSTEILQQESKKIASTFLKDILGEGISEGAITELGQQLTDYFMDQKESIDLAQIGDAALVGSFAVTPIAGTTAITNSIKGSRIASNEDVQKVQENNDKIVDLKNQRISIENKIAKESINKEINKIETENEKIIDKNIEKAKQLNEEEFNKVDQLNKSIAIYDQRIIDKKENNEDTSLEEQIRDKLISDKNNILEKPSGMIEGIIQEEKPKVEEKVKPEEKVVTEAEKEIETEKKARPTFKGKKFTYGVFNPIDNTIENVYSISEQESKRHKTYMKPSDIEGYESGELIQFTVTNKGEVIGGTKEGQSLTEQQKEFIKNQIELPKIKEETSYAEKIRKEIKETGIKEELVEGEEGRLRVRDIEKDRLETKPSEEKIIKIGEKEINIDKIIEENSPKDIEISKKEIAKNKISSGLQDLATSLGIIKLVEGTEKPDAVKAVKQIAEGFMELGIENVKELTDKIKKYLESNLGVKPEKSDELISKSDLESTYKEWKKVKEKPIIEDIGEYKEVDKNIPVIEKVDKNIIKEKINQAKKIELQNKKEVKNKIRESIIERRSDLNLSILETNLFVEGLNKELSKQERESIPFIIEKTIVPDKLERSDLQDIVNNKQYITKKGRKLTEVANDVKKHFDEVWDNIIKNTDKLSVDQIQDYVTHIWDIPKNKIDDVTKWFATKNRFLNKRYIDTYAAGIELFGLKPKTLDIGEIIRIHDSMSNTVIANNKFLKDLKNMEVNGFPIIKIKSKAPSNYIDIKHPALTVKKLIPYEGKDILMTEPYLVHPDAVKPLSVIFGHRLNDQIGIIKGYEQAGAILKKTQLSLSLFHHIALTETGIGFMGLLKTMKAFGRITYDAAKGNTPSFANKELAKDAAKHTLQFGATQDIPIKQIQLMTEKLHEFAKKKNIPVGKQMTWLLKEFNKTWDKGLWDYLHDGLKLYAYEDSVSNMPDRIKTPEDIKRYKIEMAQLINDTFGGQNWDILMINPQVQQILRWTLLSPDWTISTIRQALSPLGIGNVYKSDKFWSGSKTTRAKKGTAFWLKAGLYFGIGINLLNIYFRKKDEEENSELYEDELTFKERTLLGNTIGHKSHLFIGRYENGEEKYLRWGKQFRELPELVESPLKKIGGKASPQLQLGSQLFTGHSLSGYENWDLKDKKGLDWIYGATKTVSKSFLPFSSSNIVRSDKEWKPIDLFMPSSKGMSPSQAIKYYKKGMSFNEETGLIDFDLDYITDIYEAAVRNKLDAYGLYKISVTSVKSERTNDIKKNLKSIEDAKEQLKKTKNESDRKRIERQIKNMNKKQENIKKSWNNLHKLENELLNQEEKETKSIYE